MEKNVGGGTISIDQYNLEANKQKHCILTEVKNCWKEITNSKQIYLPTSHNIFMFLEIYIYFHLVSFDELFLFADHLMLESLFS